MRQFCFLWLCFLISGKMALGQSPLVYEYANFDRFKADNQRVMAQPNPGNRVVFMGNSITEAWSSRQADFWEPPNYINRGISGQVTHQMLLRFRRDVLDLNPAVVVILAGTNDLAQNSGPVPLEMIMENIESMTEMARFRGCKVILCSVLPAIKFPWKPEVAPVEIIPRLNQMIKAYAQKNRLSYVDYYSALVDDQGGLKVPDYTTAQDLVHPNQTAYEIMASLVNSAIQSTLRKK
ncbi:MAG: GDSL-type esterase/lipase family protein [Bacteroidota bacterium]